MDHARFMLPYIVQVLGLRNNIRTCAVLYNRSTYCISIPLRWDRTVTEQDMNLQIV